MPGTPTPETPTPGTPTRLQRSTRRVIALGEVLAALVLVALAWWCWQRGVVVTVQEGVELTRVDGRWWALAAAAATLAGLLLLAVLWQIGVRDR